MERRNEQYLEARSTDIKWCRTSRADSSNTHRLCEAPTRKVRSEYQSRVHLTRLGLRSQCGKLSTIKQGHSKATKPHPNEVRNTCLGRRLEKV